MPRNLDYSLTDGWQAVRRQRAEIASPPADLSEAKNRLVKADDPDIKDYRKLLASRALGILEQYHLPNHGENRSWVNNNLPDLQPENPDNPAFSLLTWNIQRGHNLFRQVQYLRYMGIPDILCLQEADWHCIRTGKQNIALEMAKELGYKYVTFTTAFVEIDTEDYNDHCLYFPDTQRSSPSIGRGAGVMGQAVLSKYSINATGSIKLNADGYDYSDPKNLFARIEPMHGGRVSQKIKIRIGNREVVIYNAHLESLSGPTHRISQFDQIAYDADNVDKPVIIVGDFNTCGHGLAKFFSEESAHSVKHWFRRTLAGKDFLQYFNGFGKTEAELWDKLQFANGERKSFADPFSRKDPTFKVGPGLMPFFKGKLDWTLFEEDKFGIKKSSLGPFGLSDHRSLLVEVEML